MPRLLLLLLLVVAASLPVLAQVQTPRYISMSSETHGYYEYLPQGYDPNGTATYPLILFMSGIGEFGDGSASQLPRVLRHGVPQEINNGVFPSSFTVGGQVFRFIAISPQWVINPRYPEAVDMDSVLTYIVAHYKVDVSRIYITGLSYGGGLCWAYAGHNAAFAQRVAAIVPVASPIPLPLVTGYDTVYARSRVIAANNVPVWATHNLRDHDDTVATTIAYVNDINQAPAPTPLAKMTIFNASGHDAWTKTYDPNFRENGMNIYEWMLQYKRGSAVPNQPPVANAGADQTITLPTNSVSLSGSGKDTDGSIVSFAWTQVSGPSVATITTPSAAATTVTGLQQGTYVFRLTVTDNSGATGTDDVSITVNAAPNIAPVANAGPDQTITLPTNSTTLNGSGTDSDGSIAGYSWIKISGPSGGTITTPNVATTTITALQQGTYVFGLTVTDNSGASSKTDSVTITVNAAANKPPVANAGTDQTITLPTNSVALTGTAIDSDGTISSYAWTQVAGPNTAAITTATAATTTVTGLIAGSYTFRLTVTDNNGATGSDDVVITVNAAPNVAPKANAGADQTITLPTNSITLTGSGTDTDGTIASYAWTKVSGPSGGTITTPAAAVTTVTGLQQGTYIFRLTVTDNNGATGTDDITITVNAAPNQPPTVNAGADQTITLPTNSITLSGTATDTDGSITQYAWTQVSGPANSTIATPGAASTAISGLVAGAYTFRLTVTDNNGATAFDDVVITVNAANNQTPVANAGADVAITLPTNQINLSGSGTDPDGMIASYLWTQVSGPAGAVITSKNAAATSVTGLVQGSYVFRLTVTDNGGATASDDVTVTVNAAPNQAPVANAGADITITLPTDTATLSGSGTDADGTITSYAWTKISGPTGGNITSGNAAQTTVTNLVQGTYVFRLTVTDNLGATATDDVNVVVNNALNVVPQANAGADQTINLPTNSVTVTGSGTDSDGSITSYAWTKISGPSGGTITAPDAATTTITGLVQGSYVFRLTVTDNGGATASDDVTVTVNAAPVNQPPHADAGVDQHINLPATTTTLRGSASDSDGTITAFKWTKVSGPAGGDISTPDSDSTLVTALQQGSYVFRLTVTDNHGDTASDDVTVNVSVVTAIGDDPSTADYRLIVAPNPSRNYFSLKLISSSPKLAFVQVSDAVGRVVEQRTNIQRNNVFTLGQQYRPGTYYMQVIQAGKKLTVKLLKLP